MQDVLINRPPNVTQYCKFMGGVDLSDQNQSYYPVQDRRSVKWWKYIFYFLLDICIINAWILMNQVLRKKKANMDFRVALGKELIGTFSTRKKMGRPQARPVIADTEHRFVKLLPASKGRHCKNCQRKRKQERAANREGRESGESFLVILTTNNFSVSKLVTTLAPS